MKYARIVYLPSGQRYCEACGTPNAGPCEMYEYVDEAGEKIVVCFDCRMYCTTEQSVGSFQQRHRNVK